MLFVFMSNLSNRVLPAALLLPVQSIEELHAIITERCLKTDQLGQIFAARDNM